MQTWQTIVEKPWKLEDKDDHHADNLPKYDKNKDIL